MGVFTLLIDLGFSLLIVFVLYFCLDFALILPWFARKRVESTLTLPTTFSY
jgi:hypothetical protein